MIKSILLVWLNDVKLLLFYEIEQLTIDSYTLAVLMSWRAEALLLRHSHLGTLPLVLALPYRPMTWDTV
jgi:hypothetical protein